jgi:hypothetical protein
MAAFFIRRRRLTAVSGIAFQVLYFSFTPKSIQFSAAEQRRGSKA